MLKRSISLVLMFAIIIGMLPGTVYGAETSLENQEQSAATSTASEMSDAEADALNAQYIEEAAAELRKHMVAREEEVTIQVKSTHSNSGVTLDRVVNEAIKHTGNPCEGDYLYEHMNEWTGSGWGDFDAEGVFVNTFNLSFDYKTTGEQEQQVNEAVDQVLRELNLWNCSDYDKIKGIHDYICTNVSYDDEQEKRTVYNALIEKSCVCQGYALLFYRLALELGIDTRCITGNRSTILHEWNIVELDDIYYNIDCTWDISIVLGDISGVGYDYFLKGPSFFMDHDRDNPYIKKDFLDQYPISSCDYGSSVSPEDSVVDTGDCGDSAIWTLTSDNILRITGTGGIADYNNSSAPWSNYIYYIEKVEISEGITAIGAYAFTDCVALSEIQIPNTVRSIGDFAFQNCSRLAVINIPSSLESLGKGAFSSCSNLIFVHFTGSVPNCGNEPFSGTPDYFCVYYDSSSTGWPESTWHGYPCLAWTEEVQARYGKCADDACWFVTHENILVVFGNGTVSRNQYYDEESARGPWKNYDRLIQRIVVQPGITSLGDSAFAYLKKVTEVDLPDSLHTIGIGAFSNCYNLKHIELPINLQQIGTLAFGNCGSLEKIIIPASVGRINRACFSGCGSLKEIVVQEGNLVYYSQDGILYGLDLSLHTYPAGKTVDIYEIPNGITAILDQAFDSSSIREVTIPDSCQVICNSAFSGCKQLRSVTIPSSVDKIEGYAFSGCTSLSELIILPGISELEGCVFAGCTNLEHVDLPDTIMKFGKSIFNNCPNLQTVSLPQYITDIPSHSFAFCKNLSDITIPDGVEYIGDYAFAKCENLTDVVFPEKLKRIDDGAFMECYDLNSITFLGNAPEISPYHPFNECVLIAHFPENNTTWSEDIMQNYGGSIVWSDGTRVFNSVSTHGSLGNGISWELKDRVLTIFGNGPIEDSPWKEYRDSIVYVIIENGITKIGDYAFDGCSSIREISVPDTVKSIGSRSFANCYNLRELTLPNSIIEIGEEVFDSCVNLRSFLVPSDVTDIDGSDFICCESLEEFNVETGNKEYISKDGVLYTKDGAELVAFPMGKASKTVVIPDGVTKIGRYAFTCNEEMVQVVFPDSLSIIADHAFSGCRDLVIELTEGIEVIEEYAFQSCWYASTVITIPSTVRELASTAFYGCISLKEFVVSEENQHYTSLQGVLYDKTMSTLLAVPRRWNFSRFSSDLLEIPNTVNKVSKCAFSDFNGLNTSVKFTGRAPEFAYDCFYSTDLTVFYPENYESWTNDVLNDYQGIVRWLGYFSDEAEPEETIPPINEPEETEPPCEHEWSRWKVTNPTSKKEGKRTRQCASCGEKVSEVLPKLSGAFKDVKDTEYYALPVDWAVENGVTTGTSVTTFAPEATCTRGQIVTFLWRAYGEPEPTSSKNPFKDVKSSDYFYKAVLWAVEEGITTGTGADTFSPNSGCTRAQVATLLWRAQGKPTAASKNPFTDVKQGEYFYEAVIWAVENGVTTGTSVTTFAPEATCTRGQIVTFLYRTLA